MQELSTQWDKLDTNTRQYIALTSSGANQIQNFYALMSNFDTAVDATTTALNAEGSAWRENERYMESIEAKMQKLKTSIENLILGDGGLENLVKNILDIANGFVKFIDNTGGLITVIGTLTSVLIVLNSSAIMKLIYNFPLLLTQVKALATGYVEFAMSATTVNEVMTASIPVIGLIIATFTALIAVVNYANNAYDRHLEKVKQFNDEIDIEENKIKELSKELKNTYDKIEDINSLGTIEITDEKELRNLKLQSIELERQLAIEEKRLEIAQRKKEVEAYETLTANPSKDEKSLTTGKAGTQASIVGVVTGTALDFAKSSDRLDERISKYIEIKKVMEDYVIALQKEQSTLEESDEKYIENQKMMSATKDAINEYDRVINVLLDDFEEVVVGLDEENEYRKAYIEVYNEYADVLRENQDAEQQEAKMHETINTWLEDTASNLNLTEEQYEELQQRVQDTVDSLDDEDNVLEAVNNTLTEYENELKSAQVETSNWSKELDNLQSAYATLTSAVEEYNTTGMFSVDTVQSLLNLSPEYLSFLDYENGKVKLNEQAIQKKAQSLINEAKAQVYKTAEQKLAMIAEQDSINSLRGHAEALDRDTEALMNNNQQLAKNAYLKAMTKDAKEAQKVWDDMNKQITLLDGLSKNLGSSFKSTFTDTKTKAKEAKEEINDTKNAVNALKNAVEALKQEVNDLKDEIDEYEKVIDLINDKYDEEIDKLKDLRDEEVDALEQKINALEDEKRLEEDRYKEQIRVLEEERDTIVNTAKEEIEVLKERKEAEEAYWDEKINALKAQNEELTEQAELEKLLDNLEKAKATKVRIYKEGQGFVWETDQQAVSKAQKEIEAYNRKKAYEDQLKELEDFKKKSAKNYEQQIDDLNKYVNDVKKKYEEQINNLNTQLAQSKTNYDQQITNLKNYTEDVKKNYDNQIKMIEDEKKAFNDMVNAYQNEQDRLLVLQKTGIDLEDANWRTRTNNLNKFVEDYENKLKLLAQKQEELNQKQKELNELQSQMTLNTPTVDVGDGGGTPTPTPTPNDTKNHGSKTVWTAGGHEFGTRTEAEAWVKSEQERVKKHNDGIDAQINSIKNSPHPNQSYIKQLESDKWSMPGGISQKVVYYATGISTIKENQFAVVGDDPRNRELVIGSKLNGMAMQLKKGTGVVNAKSTNTVAGLLNTLGSEFGKATTGNYNLSNMNTNNNQSIHIGTISLPEVRNSDDFITALTNFENLMIQKAYASI